MFEELMLRFGWVRVDQLDQADEDFANLSEEMSKLEDRLDKIRLLADVY